MLPWLLLAFVFLPIRTAQDRQPVRLPHAAQPAPEAATAEWTTLAALPGATPEAFSVELFLEGLPARLELRRHSLRAPDARLRLVGRAGVTREVQPPPARTYRGSLAGEPGSVVLANLTPDGLEALIVRDSGARLRLEPARVAGLDRHLHTLRPEPAPQAFACGSDDHAAVLDPDLAPRVGQQLPPHCLISAQIAFDADFEYYQAKGSSGASVVAAIDAMMNEVEYFYARDVQITYVLTAYVVRQAPFYTPTGGGSLLDQFRAEWNTNQSAIPRDMAHLMTGKPGSLIEFGGLAFVGVVCTSSQYGWSMDGANIVGHELGHNWGAGHCHDPAPCNNMCGACFNVGPRTRRIIETFRDSRPCLERVGTYLTPLPPYTAPEGFAQRKDAVDFLGPVLLDVLANDDDGNCDPLSVGAFDAQSEQGGTIRRRSSGSPTGRDLLEYSLPSTPFVGRDRFGYQAHDGRRSSPGEVFVDLEPLELVAWYPLDEGAGSSALDVTGNGLDGQAQGAPAWSTGVVGGALEFDGVDDAVVCPAPGLDSNQVTLAAWIRRSGPQGNLAGLIYSRAGSTVAGLQFGTGNELRYNWNADPAAFGWSSGLVVPDDRWVFVALVLEPQRATLWLQDGGTLTSAVHVHAHEPEAFDGALVLGRDPGGARYFAGALDEVRVYPYALNATEIATLAATQGPADAPLPRDGGKRAAPDQPLTWVPAPGATLHQVYFGTDWAAVRDATPTSPEFLGAFLDSADPGPLALGPTYFWRVDELLPEAVRGHVWQFTQAESHRWPLDESSGLTAFDASGTLHGTLLGGVLLDQPGATPNTGSSAFFDGVNDQIRIPALNYDSNRVTITTWVRRSGAQAAFAGMVFSRAGNTTAGLNFGDANELRYHWNDAGSTWSWNSGLVVPDDQWVFVALVVEPARARMYLGQGGVLASATNAVTHAPEEFDGFLILGRDPSSAARSFRGWLDDVRVYDSALTAGEIESVFLE